MFESNGETVVPPRASRGHDLRLLGLPAMAVPTVHASSRKKAVCPRRWWFEQVERLSGPTGRALAYGSAWHLVLEDIHAWWMVERGQPYPMMALEHCIWCVGRDPGGATCWHCSGTGWGPVAHIARLWADTDRAADSETLKRAAEGWLWKWGHTPPPNLRVVAVELGLGMPIRTPSGAVFAPELPWRIEPTGERLASTGEALLPDTKWEQRAWHVACRLDALWEDMELGCYMVGEFKSSADPRGWLDGLGVDPQVTVYETVLRDVIRRGLLPEAERGPDAVNGFLIDVTSSRMQRDIHVLKAKTKTQAKGEPSLAKMASVPTWRLIAGLQQLGIEIDGRWKNQIELQRMKVDDRFYMREWGTSPPEWRTRVLREILGEARRYAAWYNTAAHVEGLDDPELDIHFPRVPVCRSPGGHCPFRGPCQHDGPDARAALRRSEVAPESRGVPDDELDEWYEETEL